MGHTMRRISIHLTESQVRILDSFVDDKKAASRSEAIRAAVSMYIKSEVNFDILMDRL